MSSVISWLFSPFKFLLPKPREEREPTTEEKYDESAMSSQGWTAKSELLSSSNGSLLCPKCKKPYVNNHILQCAAGHLSCEKCDKSNTCITCKKPKARGIRNRQLEHISSSTSILDLVGATTRFPEEPQSSNGGSQRPPVTCGHCKKQNIGVWFRCLNDLTAPPILCETCIGTKTYRAQVCVRSLSTDQKVVEEFLQDYAKTTSTNEKRKSGSTSQGQPKRARR